MVNCVLLAALFLKLLGTEHKAMTYILVCPCHMDSFRQEMHVGMNMKSSLSETNNSVYEEPKLNNDRTLPNTFERGLRP